MKAKPKENEVSDPLRGTTELLNGSFPHKHRWKLKWSTSEGLEMWLECKCGRQMEVPEEDLEASYEQIHAHNTST